MWNWGSSSRRAAAKERPRANSTARGYRNGSATDGFNASIAGVRNGDPVRADGFQLRLPIALEASDEGGKDTGAALLRLPLRHAVDGFRRNAEPHLTACGMKFSPKPKGVSVRFSFRRKSDECLNAVRPIVPSSLDDSLNDSLRNWS